MRSSVSRMGVVPGGVAPGDGAGMPPLGGDMSLAGDPLAAGSAFLAGGRVAGELAEAGAGAERFDAIGSRVMWQIGHSPGSAETICGCIGQWYFATACSPPAVPCIWALAYDHHMNMARNAAMPSRAQLT